MIENHPIVKLQDCGINVFSKGKILGSHPLCNAFELWEVIRILRVVYGIRMYSLIDERTQFPEDDDRITRERLHEVR